jgi:hypothetical protein
MALGTWPPSLADLKVDAAVDADDTRDDGVFGQNLDAAVSFVERVHRTRYQFAEESGSLLPAPDVAMCLGTIRLARRWKERRLSVDALVQMGEMGAARIPSFDPDIERQLRIGRYAPPVFA